MDDVDWCNIYGIGCDGVIIIYLVWFYIWWCYDDYLIYTICYLFYDWCETYYLLIVWFYYPCFYEISINLIIYYCFYYYYFLYIITYVFNNYYSNINYYYLTYYNLNLFFYYSYLTYSQSYYTFYYLLFYSLFFPSPIYIFLFSSLFIFTVSSVIDLYNYFYLLYISPYSSSNALNTSKPLVLGISFTIDFFSSSYYVSDFLLWIFIYDPFNVFTIESIYLFWF